MHEFFYIASQVIACVFMLAMTVLIVRVLVWEYRESKRRKQAKQEEYDATYGVAPSMDPAEFEAKVKDEAKRLGRELTEDEEIDIVIELLCKDERPAPPTGVVRPMKRRKLREVFRYGVRYNRGQRAKAMEEMEGRRA